MMNANSHSGTLRCSLVMYIVFFTHYFSLAHKSNFAGHVIITTGLRRRHFPRPGIFLRWNWNLQCSRLISGKVLHGTTF